MVFGGNFRIIIMMTFELNKLILQLFNESSESIGEFKDYKGYAIKIICALNKMLNQICVQLSPLFIVPCATLVNISREYLGNISLPMFISLARAEITQQNELPPHYWLI